MSTFIEAALPSTIEETSAATIAVIQPPIPQASSAGAARIRFEAFESKESLLISLFTASAALHLLVIGLTGYGGAKAGPRHLLHLETPPPAVIENVHIEDAPPPPPLQQPKDVLNSPLTANVLAAPAPVAAVDAVGANVPVDFAIKVTGPVHLVNTTAEATSTVAAPVIIPHEVTGRNLLLPEVAYPRLAKIKHLTGHVVVEFRTTATGDIADVKINQSSGHSELDQAAIKNLRLGRWVGEAGYFTKTYEFILH